MYPVTAAPHPHAPVKLREALGLGSNIRALRARLREAGIALVGADDVPPSRFGLSSLSQLRPRLAFPLWTGRFNRSNTAVVTNLYNHTPTPIALGWSVRRTQTRDFRGKSLTYDSHNGTDFAVPVGTTVCAAAAGRVVRVYNEYNRGGLKVVIDHGHGLMTCNVHLARSLVVVGQDVQCGQPIARSGYSGLDGLSTFPWGVPHIHFGVWLAGETVDPYDLPDGTSAWVDGAPMPAGASAHASTQPTLYDEAAVDAAIAACITPSVRRWLQSIADLTLRASTLVTEWNYYPTRFPLRPGIVRNAKPATARLNLPFSSMDISTVMFADEPHAIISIWKTP